MEIKKPKFCKFEEKGFGLNPWTELEEISPREVDKLLNKLDLENDKNKKT